MFHHSKFQPMVWLWNPPIQLFDYIVTILSLARYVCFFILYISCSLYFNQKHSNLNTLQKLKVYAWRNCKIWNIRKQKDIHYKWNIFCTHIKIFFGKKKVFSLCSKMHYPPQSAKTNQNWCLRYLCQVLGDVWSPLSKWSLFQKCFVPKYINKMKKS